MPADDLDAQLKKCGAALRRDPHDPRLLGELATALVAAGRESEAADHLQRLAAALLGRRRYREAAEACRCALELDLQHPGTLEVVRRIVDGKHLPPAELQALLRRRRRRVGRDEPVVVRGRGGMEVRDTDATVQASLPAMRPQDLLEPTEDEIDLPEGSGGDEEVELDEAELLEVEEEVEEEREVVVEEPTMPSPTARRDVARKARATAEKPAPLPPAKHVRPAAARGEQVSSRAVAAAPPAATQTVIDKPAADNTVVQRTDTSWAPEPRRRFSDKLSPAALETVADDQRATEGLAAAAEASEQDTLPPPTTPSPLRGAEWPAGKIAFPREILARGSRRTVGKNEVLLAEQEESRDLCLLQKGRIEVMKWARTPRQTRLAVLEPGSWFGELALLGDGRHHLTFRALEPTQVLVLAGEHALEALTASSVVSRPLRALYRDRLQETLLRTAPLFSALKPAEARAVLRRARPLRVESGTEVIAEGTPAVGLYIVLLGRLEVTRSPKRGAAPVLLGQLGDCDVFGEMSLLHDQPTSAAVRAVTFAQLLHIEVAEFRRLAGERPALVAHLDAEAMRRERSNRAVLRGAARFDVKRGAVVYLPARKPSAT